MCGISGAVFWESPPSGIDPMTVVRVMTDALAHRGPDGEGVTACPGTRFGPPDAAPVVAFGHRRLAIIDLTDRGAQPMTTTDGGSCTITFNGEIYNFKDLRRELESCGRRFRSDSDTEVVLQGYEQWGERIVDRLRGMFAFAIWDSRVNKLLLVRDRVGIKPLYVYAANGHLLFASEIRSLLASTLVPRRLDLLAVDQYLAYQTVPSPRTLVQNVDMLLPGHVAIAAQDGPLTQRPYWDLLTCARQSESAPTDAGEARARVRHLLAESAVLHQVSDVPVGIFLSGGIDSSAITALVRDTGITPRTFAVTCPGTPFDEAPYARAAARACGAEHTEIALTESEIVTSLRDGLASLDHPTGDAMNTFVVSRAVRQTGIKVALSGLGGDEFFGGYPSFARIDQLSTYAKAWRRSPASMRRMAGAAVRTFGGRSVTTAKTAALVETDGTLPQTFPILRQVFSADQRRELLTPAIQDLSRTWQDPYVALLDGALSRQPDLDTMALVSYAEARTYMHDVLLRDTDQMSMRHGLEVRVPLLDHLLIECLMGLPAAAKRAGSSPKPLLVESLATPLPRECVDRPKRGFVLPFELWMRGPLREFSEHHLGQQGLSGRGVLRADSLEALWQSFLNNEVKWSRPWALIALNAWMESTGVSA